MISTNGAAHFDPATTSELDEAIINLNAAQIVRLFFSAPILGDPHLPGTRNTERKRNMSSLAFHYATHLR